MNTTIGTTETIGAGTATTRIGENASTQSTIVNALGVGREVARIVGSVGSLMRCGVGLASIPTYFSGAEVSNIVNRGMQLYATSVLRRLIHVWFQDQTTAQIQDAAITASAEVTNGVDDVGSLAVALANVDIGQVAVIIANMVMGRVSSYVTGDFQAIAMGGNDNSEDASLQTTQIIRRLIDDVDASEGIFSGISSAGVTSEMIVLVECLVIAGVQTLREGEKIYNQCAQ